MVKGQHPGGVGLAVAKILCSRLCHKITLSIIQPMCYGLNL